MLKWAVLALVLSASVGQADQIVVKDDGGGNINEYRARRAQLAKADSVIIMGKCLSACVIFTTLPNACVGRKAQIGFHGSSIKYGIPAIDLWLDMRMGEYLRGEVQRLYIADWRHLSGSNEFHVISGQKYKTLDPKIKICE